MEWSWGVQPDSEVPFSGSQPLLKSGIVLLTVPIDAVKRKMNIIRTVLSLTTLNSTVLKELKMITIPYENKY